MDERQGLRCRNGVRAAEIQGGGNKATHSDRRHGDVVAESRRTKRVGSCGGKSESMA